MGSKIVRNRDGEIVGMIEDPVGDAENLGNLSARDDGYDAAGNDEYWRENHPIRYWGGKLWKWLCVMLAIVVSVVLFAMQRYSDALLALVSIVIVYFLPMLFIYVLPMILHIYVAIFMGIWHIISMPFTAVIELLKALSNLKKK